MDLEKGNSNNFPKANGLRIENNLNSFRMIAVVAICRIWYFTTRVATLVEITPGYGRSRSCTTATISVFAATAILRSSRRCGPA
jgi:hypothetical protein